jgi:hypothetical protein
MYLVMYQACVRVCVILRAMRNPICQNLTVNRLATFHFNHPKQRFIRYFRKYSMPTNVRKYHRSIRTHFRVGGG